MILTDRSQIADCDFLEGVSLLVNKPSGWTSFDVVNKIRFLLKNRLGIRKIKVGHAGTLDPLATGLLIVAIGRDTKEIAKYQGLPKRYSGTFRLGATTPSYDREFEADAHFDIDHIDARMIEEVRKSFLGQIMQFPPVFSALRVDGKRAYQLARKGKSPELKSRQVHIYEFEIDASAFPDLNFKVLCEKGTYIRSLAHDFGKALHSGAFLLSLHREQIGDYNVVDALDIETLVDILQKPGSR